METSSVRKKRILFVGEASFLSTGFSTYWAEIIKRLHSENLYEIAEFGSYAEDGDQRINSIPWRFYPVAPNKNDEEGQRIYKSNPINQFGSWRFNQVCLDFKPDCVLTIRDFWMDSFIQQSPFRNNFKWLWLLTIDGWRQRDLWLDSYTRTDGNLTYSKWAWDLMKRDGFEGTNMIAVASPGSDLDLFKPSEDKRAHKTKLGIDPNTIIIGTVMRNQKRKLYYDLIEAFSKWVYKAKTKGHIDLVKKVFLYLHCSYPDVGYDIGRAIQEFKVGTKVLLTYMCQTCGTVYPSFFQGEWAVCRRCKNKTAHPPNANSSPSREVLAEIMKLFDLYVQYSICLGKDEEIKTKNGWKKISDIEIGEEVFTHQNRYKKVLQKFINPNNGNIKEISVHSDYEKLIITDNHPCYSYTRANLNNERKDSARSILGNMILLNKNIPSPQWVEVKDLKPNDCLVYCIDDSVVNIDRIDLKEFAKAKDIILDNFIEVHKGDTYPRYINVDEEFCEFLGLYVADGSSNISKSSQIQVTYSNKEIYNENLCKSIWQKLSNKSTTIAGYKDRKAFDAKMCSRLHNEIFDLWCSRKENKKLPDWCLNLPNNKTKAILKGLFIGDGHKDIKDKCSKYCTISKTLADQIKHLLRRNRINFNCHIDYRNDDKDKRNRKPQYLFEVPGFICDNEFINKRSSTHNLYYKNYHILKIKNIKNSNYNEKVYNIEVENDNSYKTKIAVLHNCEGWGMPLTDAMACGISCAAVRSSAMNDHLECPGSIPIEVGRFFYESVIETEQKRALPNNDDFVQKLDNFVKMSEEKRNQISKKIRAYAVEPVPVFGQEEKLPRFSWSRTAAIWRNVLNETEIKDPNLTWFCPTPQLIKPNLSQPPNDLDNVQFINYIIKEIWCKPEMINSYFALDWVRFLNQGFRIEGSQKISVDRQYVGNHFLNLVNQQNKAEEHRVALLNPNKNEINFEVM